MRYGYVRVSTDMQDYHAQKTGILRRHEIDAWREDTGTGRRTQPNLLRLIEEAKAGDEVVVYAFDRLGRATQQVIGIVSEFRRRNVGVISIREGIDLNSPAGNMVFQMMCSIAEFESAIIADRIKSGMVAAKERGQRLGRTSLMNNPDTAIAIEKARALRGLGYSLREISEQLYDDGIMISYGAIVKYTKDQPKGGKAWL